MARCIVSDNKHLEKLIFEYNNFAKIVFLFRIKVFI